MSSVVVLTRLPYMTLDAVAHTTDFSMFLKILVSRSSLLMLPRRLFDITSANNRTIDMVFIRCMCHCLLTCSCRFRYYNIFSLYFSLRLLFKIATSINIVFFYPLQKETSQESVSCVFYKTEHSEKVNAGRARGTYSKQGAADVCQWAISGSRAPF